MQSYRINSPDPALRLMGGSDKGTCSIEAPGRSCQRCSALRRPCSWTLKNDLVSRGWLSLGNSASDTRVVNISPTVPPDVVRADSDDESRDEDPDDMGTESD
jgi:hypothetical protein